MSLIPADESAPGGSEGTGGEADEQSGSIAGRVVGRVANGIDRVRRVFGRLVPGVSTGGDDGAGDGETLPDSVGSTALVTSSGETGEPTALDVDATVRALPGTGSPEPDEPDERPEVTAQLDDGELTLEEPDESGAHITSDCWEEVER